MRIDYIGMERTVDGHRKKSKTDISTCSIPLNKKWRNKAMEDFKQGLMGILTNRHVIQ